MLFDNKIRGGESRDSWLKGPPSTFFFGTFAEDSQHLELPWQRLCGDARLQIQGAPSTVWKTQKKPSRLSLDWWFPGFWGKLLGSSKRFPTIFSSNFLIIISCILDLFHNDESQERTFAFLSPDKESTFCQLCKTAFLQDFAGADLDNLNLSCQKYPHFLNYTYHYFGSFLKLSLQTSSSLFVFKKTWLPFFFPRKNLAVCIFEKGDSFFQLVEAWGDEICDRTFCCCREAPGDAPKN